MSLHLNLMASHIKQKLRCKKILLKNYKNPQRMEHDAHCVAQPALMDYASGKIETIDEMYFTMQKSEEKGVNVAHLGKVKQGQKS